MGFESDFAVSEALQGNGEVVDEVTIHVACLTSQQVQATGNADWL